MIEHRAFFGDGEKTFSLTRPMIEELQRKTGVGIGALFARIQTQAFGLQDIAETIRCALIGGGTSPAEADALVKTYVEEQPLFRSVDLAHVILALRFFGKPEEPQDEPGQTGKLDPAARLHVETAPDGSKTAHFA